MSKEERGFELYYAQRKQALGVLYEADEFLYPHDEPWPEMSFDYPYGQAPQVMNVPDAEHRDWADTIGRYYTENAVGSESDPTPFGVASAKFARDHLFENGLAGYPPVSDEDFLDLMCEGLYSKFLSPLDPQDLALFGLTREEVDAGSTFEYFKSDYRCMMVVQDTWPNEYACPTIVLVRRLRGGKARYADEGAYELVAIAMGRYKAGTAPPPRDPKKKDDRTPRPIGIYEFPQDLLFWREKHAQLAGWYLAKYFVLQGAIHRINLIDHVKVHFPPDTINAITKTVLPKWHLVHQLLLPHFRLTLPVNNTVLEGQRSLINRDTWYPWSPFVAKGNEVRKLFPFAWAGAGYFGKEYYGEDVEVLSKNSSYRPFRYSTNPDGMPDADDPARLVPNFIGLDCSRYGAFLKAYYAPILEFTTAVVALLGDPPAKPEESSVAWLEVRRWAHEISKMLPGFPDEDAICAPGELARVCAMVIWNAGVVHCADHTTLHVMMDRKPVPFVLRVPPPSTCTQEITETVEAALGPKLSSYLVNAITALLPSAAGGVVRSILEGIGEVHLSHAHIPLCWPTDLIYARMADLLFYRPHNTTLLYDCIYDFERTKLTEAELQLEAEWLQAGRPVLTEYQKDRLRALRQAFQVALDGVNLQYYQEDGTPRKLSARVASGVAATPNAAGGDEDDTDTAMSYLNEFGFPKLRPGSHEQDDTVRKMLEREACLGAGVQY
ncbi:MAG TPA: hypothetical protein VMT50_04500 [Steroidobacteraceae bacterium]|nr:hypothetical protein [Steroidobacteraceae bacterium]